MPLVVHKYGGSSVATPDHIKRVAARITRTKQEGNDVVVVVSAMGRMTDELVDLAHAISPHPNAREFDMLLATGEQVAVSLPHGGMCSGSASPSTSSSSLTTVPATKT